MNATTHTQKSLVGALLLSPHKFIEVSELIRPAMFTGREREAIQYMYERDKNGKAWDIAVMSDATNIPLDYLHDCMVTI